jgi:hypothetical protein
MQLEWKTITPSNHHRYMVVGCEIDQAIVPNCLSRYAIVMVRRYDSERNADLGYSIRDANTITDEDIRNGKRPKQIAYFLYEDEAIEFIKKLLTEYKSPVNI